MITNNEELFKKWIEVSHCIYNVCEKRGGIYPIV
jgi:hypothetical protein